MKVAILSYTFPRGMGYIGNMLPKYLARFGADVHYITMDLPHYFQSGMSASSYGQFSGTDVVKPGTVESVDGQVHYHFPVEIEVRGAAEAADIEALIDRALVRLAQAVENR